MSDHKARDCRETQIKSAECIINPNIITDIAKEPVVTDMDDIIDILNA